ncbi:N-formylglutamate amidohydrolase [Coralloluteibacterium thermophilus]|uniref:N-formylglutamate amidohydrolase n=1 Tax=Coralloluteibacterium thermophilum TaxID=2707049 RepID=A0ABV9NKC9_9GAMM
MHPTSAFRLLGPNDPPPFVVERAAGASPFVLICDHAGRAVPEALGDLGVPAPEWDRHIAWDIGARGVALHLAALLDAFLVTQTYSRLVIDCNRPHHVPGLVPERSERTDIPGNVGLDPVQREARLREIHTPYHAAIAAELDRRAAAGLPTVLVSVHSFTPVYMDQARDMHVGVLYQHDARASHALRDMIRAEGEWVVGDNAPYSVSDETDYAIPVHAERRGLPYLELELRQDLIADAAGQRAWAERVAGWLRRLPAFPAIDR